MRHMAFPAARAFLAVTLLLSFALASVPTSSEAGQNTWTKLDLDGQRVQALAVDPADPNTLFAGTNGSGIFRSTDRGQSWVAVNGGLGNLVVNDIAVDPTNSSAVIAATGRGGLVGEETAGIYRTTNRGGVWALRSQNSADALAFDPTNASIVYAAGAPPVRKSTDGGVTWSASFDSGSVILNNEPRGITVDPENPSIILAAGNTEGGTGQVFRSTNAGATWSLVIGDFPPILDVTFAPPAAPGSVAFLAVNTGVFRSLDGGVTFSRVTEELGDVVVRDVLVNPRDASVVFAATQNRGVIRSTDGGSDWSELDGSLGNRNVFALAIDTASPQTLYAGTADGAWTFTFPAQAPRVDARIQIVFPHAVQGNVLPVSEAPLVNVAVFLFDTGTLTPVACGFPNRVTLRWALNQVRRDGVASQTPGHDVAGQPAQSAVGVQETRTIDGITFPVWVFNNVPVPFVQQSSVFDPARSKQFFFVQVDGVDFRTNIWSHGDDPRTFFPTQLQPQTRGVPPTSPIDSVIQVVFPHDILGNVRPVAEAPLANLAVDLFQHPLGGAIDADALRAQNRPVRLLRALNDGLLLDVSASPQVIQTGPGSAGFTWPRWEFNNVDVSAAQNPNNKYFFAALVGGIETHGTIWSHGAEARTIFPLQDRPERSGAGCR